MKYIRIFILAIIVFSSIKGQGQETSIKLHVSSNNSSDFTLYIIGKDTIVTRIQEVDSFMNDFTIDSVLKLVILEGDSKIILNNVKNDVAAINIEFKDGKNICEYKIYRSNPLLGSYTNCQGLEICNNEITVISTKGLLQAIANDLPIGHQSTSKTVIATKRPRRMLSRSKNKSR